MTAKRLPALRGAAKASNAAITPPGSEPIGRVKCHHCAPRLCGAGGRSRFRPRGPCISRGSGPVQRVAPYRPVIVAAWERDLSAQRIYQDLVGEHGFTGSYCSVRRFIRRLGRRAELPFRRMECEPGDEAQVDFGRGMPIVLPDGRRRLTHVFRIVFSHSAKLQRSGHAADDRGVPPLLENAFGPLRRGAAAGRARQPEGRGHAGRLVRPRTQPQDPGVLPPLRHDLLADPAVHAGHKGKVERGVGYAKYNALKGRTFASLDEQNRFLQEWERTVADTRIHGTTRRQVGPDFTLVERPALVPLPPARFPCFQEGRRSSIATVTSRSAGLLLGPAGVPGPEGLGPLGRPAVRLFNHRLEQIAVHVQREPGRFSTQSKHIAAEKISRIERGAAWILGRIRLVGPHCTKWAEACVQARGVEGVRVLQGLLSLTHRHPVNAIERACEIAQSYGAYRLRTVRRLIDRDAPKQLLAFCDDDPIIRPLSDYDRFVHDAIQKGASS